MAGDLGASLLHETDPHLTPHACSLMRSNTPEPCSYLLSSDGSGNDLGLHMRRVRDQAFKCLVGMGKVWVVTAKVKWGFADVVCSSSMDRTARREEDVQVDAISICRHHDSTEMDLLTEAVKLVLAIRGGICQADGYDTSAVLMSHSDGLQDTRTRVNRRLVL